MRTRGMQAPSGVRAPVAVRMLLTSAAAFALAVGAYVGPAGAETSGFTLTVSAGDVLLLTAVLFVLYALWGLPFLLVRPLLKGRGRGEDSPQRRLIHGMATVTIWAFLVLTFLPLKGTETFVRAGALTTLQLNAIGLVAVLVAGFVGGLVVAAIAGSVLRVLRRRLTQGGMRALGIAVGAIAIAVATVGSASRSKPVALMTPRDTNPPRVVLIGVDGCDWGKLEPLVEAGRVPTFERLMSGGCYGPLESLDVLVSPRIWTTIATGKTPEKHGIEDFVNADGIPVNSTMRTASPVWDVVSAHGLSVGVVGWYVTWPVERVNGFVISDRTHSLLRGPVQLLHSLTGSSTNERLETFGRFRYDPNYRSYPRSDKRYQLNRIVDEPLRWGYLRDLIYSQLGYRLYERYRPAFAATYFRGTDFVEHFFWKYSDPEPFGNVTNAELRAYGGVIDNYYEYQDAILERLLASLGDDVNIVIVSDHGFEPRLEPPEDRPQLTGQHRREAVFLASGPAFRSSGRFEGGTVFDVAPTLLAVMGLPVPDDMDGRVLTEILRDSHLERLPVVSVPSYETALRHDRQAAVGSPMDESIREQLRSLGYIE